MKRLKYLFIFPLLLAPLFFSVNVSAITFTTEISPTGNVFSTSGVSCKYLHNTPSPQLSYCPITQLSSGGSIDYLSSVSTSNTIHTVAGNYYSAIVTIRSQNQPKPMLWSINTSSNFSVAAINKIEDDSLGHKYFLNYASGNGAITGSSESYSYAAYYEVILRAYYTGYFNWTFGYNDAILWTNYIDFSSRDNILILSNVSEYSGVDNSSVADAINEQNEKDDQDRENAQNQQSDVSSDADDSSAQAESTGQTLLVAFSGFVSAITNARPSNCKIDMDMGNLDLGMVDFCQLSPPPAVQTIASILLIFFCVPLSFATARKVISLFRSFQK